MEGTVWRRAGTHATAPATSYTHMIVPPWGVRTALPRWVGRACPNEVPVEEEEGTHLHDKGCAGGGAGSTTRVYHARCQGSLCH